MKHSIKKTLVILGAGLVSLPALAYQQGDMVLRMDGSVSVPTHSSSAIRINNVPQLNTEVKTISSTQPSIGFMMMVHNSFGVELQLNNPFQHNLKGRNLVAVSGSSEVGLGQTRLFIPELNLQWYPLEAKSVFQPYAGVGVHYAMFSDRKAYTSGLSSNGGTAKLDFDNKFGWNLQLGMDMALNKDWSLNVAARYDAIKSTGVAYQTYGVTTDSYAFDLNPNPVIYSLGLSYKF